MRFLFVSQYFVHRSCPSCWGLVDNHGWFTLNCPDVSLTSPVFDTKKKNCWLCVYRMYTIFYAILDIHTHYSTIGAPFTSWFYPFTFLVKSHMCLFKVYPLNIRCGNSGNPNFCSNENMEYGGFHKWGTQQ